MDFSRVRSKIALPIIEGTNSLRFESPILDETEVHLTRVERIVGSRSNPGPPSPTQGVLILCSIQQVLPYLKCIGMFSHHSPFLNMTISHPIKRISTFAALTQIHVLTSRASRIPARRFPVSVFVACARSNLHENNDNQSQYVISLKAPALYCLRYSLI